MFNKKVAIVTFHNGFSANDIGGASSGPIYLADQLRSYFPDIDLITLRNNKKDFSPIASHVRFENDPSILSNYDFIIFTGPGLTYEKYDEKTPDKYIDVLNHTKKFTFICNEENDRKLYPYHMNFLTHPNISFVTFNSPGMLNTFQEYVDVVGDWEYVSFSPLLPTKDIILERANHKENKIMSTCRWTTAKRVYEYLSMSKDFIDHGIKVYAAGAHQSYWYNLKMSELPNEYYTDIGYFEPSQIPELLKDIKYHWNFLFLMRNMGLRNHQPRLEIATMESFREGCLPVICKEFTPDWLGAGSAVRLSKDDYLSIPSVLGDMKDDERVERMSLLYDLISINSIAHYKEVAEHIESVI